MTQELHCLVQIRDDAAVVDLSECEARLGGQVLERPLGEKRVAVAQSGDCVIEVIEVVCLEAPFLIPAGRCIERGTDTERAQ